MDFTVIRNNFIRNLSNIPGWTTGRKIIVIESDDWGSIRMPSREVFNILESKGLNLTGGDSKRYNLNDTLASSEDLNALFDTLSSFSDKNKNPCVFTVVCVVANPDFEKIKENDFKEYFYEPFTETLNRYYQNTDLFGLWKKGIEDRIFVPQFHGREHLNVGEWMRALQQNDQETLAGFEYGVWGFIRKPSNAHNVPYQAVFDFFQPDDLTIQAKSIKEGLALFQELFGYKARYFVPPNGPFNNSLEEVAAECGINYMLASKIQEEPQGYGKNRRVFHWLGQQNKHNQRYIVRNCFFEPGKNGKDWIKSCLKEIDIAFRWHKPAVISSHRVNYIGTHYKNNRKNGLLKLNLLLTSILQNWPDAEFMTSDQLGDLIERDLLNG
jgi:hypothetical protein